MDSFLQTLRRLSSQALIEPQLNKFLMTALEAALGATGGIRAFLATIAPDTGALEIAERAGKGWTDQICSIRLHPHNQNQRGITGHVAITGSSYAAASLSADPYAVPIFADALSEAAVPVIDSERQVRGVLNVQSDREAAFKPDEIAKLESLASVIALALTLQEYRERENVMAQLGRELASTTEEDDLSQRVVDLIVQALRCEACSLFLMDEQRNLLTLKATRSSLCEQVGKLHYDPGEGLTGTVAKTGEIIRLDDPRSDVRWKGIYPEFAPDEGGAFLAAPILCRDRTLGVLRVSRPRSTPAWFHSRFTECDERTLQAIGAQLGAAIANARTFNRLLHSERMAAWGELSAKSAHMIGNRTFAIKGDINEMKHLLAEHSASSSNLDETFESNLLSVTDSMERGVGRLEQILREFRDFVMATHLNLQEKNMNEIVTECIQETFPRHSNVLLEQSYDPLVPSIRCDPDRLKRALSEIVENSLSFQTEGGRLKALTTFLKSGESPAITGLSNTRPYIQIEIIDGGPGVKETNKDKIFTPFYSSRVKGMGLGLSIVKGIIDAHHGEIRELGEYGAGARFVICLPA